MPNTNNLSRKQKHALILTEAAGPAAITSSSTCLCDGKVFVNWRTAQSLHDRGLAKIDPPMPSPDARFYV